MRRRTADCGTGELRMSPQQDILALMRPPTQIGGVAGVHAPAFVERHPDGQLGDIFRVAPSFTSRPSLSEPGGRRTRARPAGSPGFTPRPLSSVHSSPRTARTRVSRGFTPRPSLQRADSCGAPRRCRVSPGFTPRSPRPSLSVVGLASARRIARSVAGVHAPAFVERSGASDSSAARSNFCSCRRGSCPGLR